ncbi:MAG TPA: hypothetical protein VF258_09005 [Luteolibacter sp.]
MAHHHHEEWTLIQIRRCAALGELLYLFYEKHHNSPASLEELVDAGFLTESLYRELMCQQYADSELSEWKYHAPQDPQKFPLFSGKPITTWNCPLTTYIVGHPGGGVSFFRGNKLDIYRRHHLHPSQLEE